MKIDKVHPVAEQTRQNKNIKVVHALRGVIEDKASVRNPSYDRHEKFQINKFFISKPTLMQFHNFKIIYKRYAGLYFALCIDLNDNELLHL